MRLEQEHAKNGCELLATHTKEDYEGADCCEERQRLSAKLLEAMKDWVDIQSSLPFAPHLGNKIRSDVATYSGEALRNWRSARLAYMQHLRAHGC